ncbi:hypothetical protein TNCV_2002921 [Trichonephila clavipes]|nr:hypothetical protein TNCV_2002921 [Trichonephila clavipes]
MVNELAMKLNPEVQSTFRDIPCPIASVHDAHNALIIHLVETNEDITLKEDSSFEILPIEGVPCLHVRITKYSPVLNWLHGYLTVVQPSSSSFCGGCWLYADSPHHKILQKTPLVLTITIRPTREERALFRFFLSALASIQSLSHHGL